MKLLTVEIMAKLPGLYETEETETEDKMLPLKLFCPWNNWTWYAAEGGPVNEYGEALAADAPADQVADYLFFGLVFGHEREWGYFSLRELESVSGPAGLRIERDLHWQPKTAREVLERGY